jgi:hypothetical protein
MLLYRMNTAQSAVWERGGEDADRLAEAITDAIQALDPKEDVLVELDNHLMAFVLELAYGR